MLVATSGRRLGKEKIDDNKRRRELQAARSRGPSNNPIRTAILHLHPQYGWGLAVRGHGPHAVALSYPAHYIRTLHSEWHVPVQDFCKGTIEVFGSDYGQDPGPSSRDIGFPTIWSSTGRQRLLLVAQFKTR